jgi:uncharacterized membrane protein
MESESMGTARRPSPPADKRAQFTEPASSSGRRLTPALAIGATALLLAAALGFAFLRGAAPAGPESSSSVQSAAGQDVVLPLSEFEDGRARFYTYVTGSRTVRFFVLKSSDGVIRAAFDACDVCFRDKRGYRQAGDVMVCNNCEQTFPSTGINVLQGGCNPVPIERSVADGQVVLRAASLAQGAFYF